jgi:hypothetical protein
MLRRVIGQAAAALLLALVVCVSFPAFAALVVFEDGRSMRVASYDMKDGDRMELSLHGGGSITIPLDLIDRIVDEEYERVVEKPVEDAPAASEAPILALRSIRVFSAESPSGALRTSPFSTDILAAARKHRIDPAFIAAVIRAESNFYPRAVSRKGARGLMQLMPATARRLGVRSTFDPRDNIQGGAAYLAELAERFGDSSVDLILAAYNAGEHAVEEYRGVPPYRETRDYVRRVTALWKGAL